MNNNEACAEYFRGNSAYRRCFSEFEKKWKTYGKVTGIITLKNTSEEERRAIGGILGKTFYENTIRFPFAEFEKGLQYTKFAPVDFEQVLEAYFGRKMLTTQERQKEAERGKADFFETVESYLTECTGPDSIAVSWLQDMFSQKKYGYQTVIREYGRDREKTEKLLKTVGKAILLLEDIRETEEEYPLAVFSAEVSGNPHYFDQGTTGGQLLVHGMCYATEEDYPANAHQWRELLLSNGIVMLKYYGVLDKEEELKDWYDGYLFGSTEIYNPWSVINYISRGCIPQAYWVNTGKNEILEDVLKVATEDITERLYSLLQGERVIARIDQNVVYRSLSEDPANIYSLLLVAGYLKTPKKELQADGSYLCEVSIPNAEFVNGNGGGFNHYSELKAYKPFYSRDLPSVAKWAKWRNDGIKQMCGNDCPFCTNILPSSIRSQNEIISKVFKNSALSVANAVLEYVQQAVDQGYILPDAVDVLESYIGDNTKADELYAELQMLAKETDYLYKKIEKICMFKPMNVTHAQLVNLEQSLSELVIEERQLQSFYATDLIKKLIYHVSDKINALKGKTGQLKGLFLQHEKKLDELIAQRQDDINQFFTIAGFPYNFCLEKDGEKHAKAYLVPCEFQKEMVVDPKNRLSWGEKNAFSLVMFMFEAISDNADLIVLDDPISAFDEKKKFGIIRRLFDNKKDSFKEKTVLMLTHDFQPIIDYVHGNFFTRYGLITPVHASFIQNIEGSICESPITMNDLKNTVELTKDIVMSSNASMAVKIVNLRKYVELTKPEFGTSAIYEVLSNVIHGRQNPIYKDGQEISADVLEQGMREVSQYIPNKSYTDLINGTSTEILISSMSSDDLYHRIISITTPTDNVPEKEDQMHFSVAAVLHAGGITIDICSDASPEFLRNLMGAVSHA